jgi:NAD(P)-dependent dehydrogenase (short-subunit alcohol dehydrogenase family)
MLANITARTGSRDANSQPEITQHYPSREDTSNRTSVGSTTTRPPATSADEISVHSTLYFCERGQSFAAFGQVDLLVHNAGVVFPNRFADQPIEQVRQTLDVHLFGAWHVGQPA